MSRTLLLMASSIGVIDWAMAKFLLRILAVDTAAKRIILPVRRSRCCGCKELRSTCPTGDEII